MSHELYRIIRLLEARRIRFELARYRDDSIMITAMLVGERIEIDVFEDGHVEYSRFLGSEDVESDVEVLDSLLKQG